MAVNCLLPGSMWPVAVADINYGDTEYISKEEVSIIMGKNGLGMTGIALPLVRL